MPLQVNKKMIEGKEDEPFLLHCMPVHVNYEMAEDVLPDVHEKNIMYDQAENRMWAQMGLLVWLDRHAN
ncbi:MAG: hypothetical protein ACXAEU_24105 [Candidatus Hodarchaeales archaeon]